MDKTLKIALVLTAMDKMSGVIGKSVDASNAKIKALQQGARESFGKSAAFGGMAVATAGVVAPMISNYAKLEEAQLRLKSNMLQDGGILDTKTYAKMSSLAIDLGNELKGNSADFFNMETKLKQLGITEQSILAGAGKAAAYLAIATNDSYETSAEVVAKLKEATGTADKDLNAFIDTIARTANLGVNTGEMSYAFARSAGALKSLNLQGLDASKSVSALYAMLIKTGQSGETIGTGMTSVMSAAMDTKKMKAFNDELGKYGVNVNLVDQQTGQFKGVENMIGQFDMLKKLNPQQLSNAVTAWLGPGADAGFVKILANAGVKGYNEMVSKMAQQASLDKKVNTISSGVSQKWEAAMGTMENAFAQFGETLAPTVKSIADGFNSLFGGIQAFAQANPNIAKFIGLTIAATAAVFGIVSAINFVKGAFITLKIFMAASPIGAIIMGIALAAMLIISNWSSIKAFFAKLWASIKSIFLSTWNWVKNMFLNYTPGGLIIKHWAPIKNFFSNLWASVKNIFKGFVNWIFGLGSTFYNAGVNILKSIWNGIKSMINKPIEAIKGMVQKIRNFLPFSPAKEGPLRDIHRIKLVETIAQSIKAAPAVEAMQKVASAIFNNQPAGSPRLSPVASVGGGNITINFAPVINGAGGNIINELKKYEKDLLRLIDEAVRKRERTKF